MTTERRRKTVAKAPPARAKAPKQASRVVASRSATKKAVATTRAKTASPSATAFGLIFAQLDVPPELEEEFNDWYDTEHIPERLGISGFRTGRRGERRTAPRYIALYDLDSLACLDADAYKAKTGVNRSPWTARMLKVTRTFTRRLYHQLAPGREVVVPEHAHTVMRFVPHAGSSLEALQAHVAEVRTRKDATARLYDGREKALGEYLVLYTTDDAAVAASLADGGPGEVHVYGPYSREPLEDDTFTNLPRDARGASDAFYRRGYTDGLPIIPPTDELVAQMIGSQKRPAHEVLGLMAPKQGEVTIEALAVNAVMAGCRPEYFCVVIAAVEALLDPRFNLLGVQATTHPVTPLLVVSGPIRYELGFNLAGNAMGEGTQANATIGRAIRLILRNVGGGRPGRTDFTTQGSPARFGFCVAENQEESPFPPLHVALGYAPEQSVVTVCQAEGPHNVNDHSSQTALSFLQMLAGTMATFGTNDLARGGHPTVALGPEHARLLSREGWTREKMQAWLCEHARVLPSSLNVEMRDWLLARDDIDKSVWTDRGIPIGAQPTDFLVFVAGGTGRHSSFMPSFGFGRPATRLIDYTPTGAPPPLIPECDC